MHAFSQVNRTGIARSTEPVGKQGQSQNSRLCECKFEQRFVRKNKRKSTPKRFKIEPKSVQNRLPGRPRSLRGPECRPRAPESAPRGAPSDPKGDFGGTRASLGTLGAPHGALSCALGRNSDPRWLLRCSGERFCTDLGSIVERFGVDFRLFFRTNRCSNLHSQRREFCD